MRATKIMVASHGSWMVVIPKEVREELAKLGVRGRGNLVVWRDVRDAGSRVEITIEVYKG